VANSRFYSSTALETQLVGSITNVATTITLAANTGFPGTLPFTLAIDYDAANMELVEVTSGSNPYIVTRAIDGTTAASHNNGAVVRHVSSARDFTDSRTHEAATANVHGVTGALVGATQVQTLTNKTLTSPTINSGALSGTFTGTPTFSGNVTHSGEIILTNLLRGSRALSSDSQYETRVTGDANARWFMDTTGKMSWGPGTAGIDTNLYRSGSNTLATDDQFQANRPLGTDVTFGGRRAADTNSRWYVTADGALTWGDGAGLIDVNLARSSAGTVTLTGNLAISGIGGTFHARKTADTSVTSQTIPQPDPHLLIPVVANAVYEMDGILFITSTSTTPDVGIQMDGPASSAGTWQTIAPPTSATTDDSTVRTIANSLGVNRTYGLQTASQVFGFPVSGMIETAGTAGNLQVSWAQSTSSATATTMKIYSWIRLTRVA
jgi:hypothetical protein